MAPAPAAAGSGAAAAQAVAAAVPKPDVVKTAAAAAGSETAGETSGGILNQVWSLLNQAFFLSLFFWKPGGTDEVVFLNFTTYIRNT